MVQRKQSIWIRLRKALRRIILPPRGDGGAHSDKLIQISRPPADTTLVQDSVIVKR